jgi:hypothetical protein
MACFDSRYSRLALPFRSRRCRAMTSISAVPLPTPVDPKI